MSSKLTDKQRNRLYGTTITDFAYAESVEAACEGLFHNLQKLFGFKADFAEKAMARFPDTSIFNSLSDTQKEIVHSICSASIKSDELYDLRIGGKFAYKRDYCPITNMIRLEMDTERPPKPKIIKSSEDILPIKAKRADTLEEKTITFECNLSEVKNLLIKNEVLAMELKDKLEDIEKEHKVISEFDDNDISIAHKFYLEHELLLEGYKHLEGFQSNVGKFLTALAEGLPLTKALFMDEFIIVYNNHARIEVDLFPDNGLIKFTHPFDSYFFLKWYGEQRAVANAEGSNWYEYIAAPVSYVIVEFCLEKGNIALVKKCSKCKKCFIAKTKRRDQQFCSTKCRLAHHNKIRIESGKHAKYKRERRASGKATESYYR